MPNHTIYNIKLKVTLGSVLLTLNMVSAKVHNESTSFTNYHTEVVTYIPSKRDSNYLEPTNLKREKDSLYLTFSVLAVNLLALLCGIGIAWPSSVFPKLKSEENALGTSVTTIQLSLIASITEISQICGPLVFVFINEKYGRKYSNFWISIPYLIGYIILGLASTVWFYYIARLLIGFSMGAKSALIPTYISEISEDHNRAKYTVYYIIFINIGFLYSYAVGPFVSLRNFNLICSLPAVLYLLLWTFTPESPVYLVKNGEKEKAKICLGKLRKKSPANIYKDVIVIENYISLTNTNKKINIMNIMESKSFQKALTLSIFLLSNQVLLGINTVIGFAQQIFIESGSTVFSKYLPIIAGAYLVVITFIMTRFVVERFNRKSLMLLGTAGTTFALILMVTFFSLKSYIPESFKYTSLIPLTFFLFYFTSLQCYGPLTWIVSNEIFETNAKSFGMSISTSVYFLVMFITTFLFPILRETWGLAIVFLIHSIFSALTFLFVLLLIPETKDKTYFEIQDLMSKHSWLVYKR